MDFQATRDDSRLTSPHVIGALALFAALTVVMTWPQALHLATDAENHQDVFFNMWRLRWVAHALGTAPFRLLDGNIFYPEPRTLTFSDAMPVEAILAAPLTWAGAPPVLVHNLVLLAGIVLSATGIFVLATHVTGSRAAGITAGIIFAFVPYRFEHYMHMELQWTVWIPWALWALHRLFETGQRRFVVWLGFFVALQFMSSVYYGMFLATVLVVFGILLLSATTKALVRNRLALLAAAGTIAVLLSVPYALPYAATRQHVGPRPQEQVLAYSAHPASYLVATDTNYLYGKRSIPRGRSERRLFPGLLPLLLAVVGLLLRPPSNTLIVYVLALVFAFEMSLGFYGYTFTFLYHHVPLFDSLRAPARLGIFVVFFLAILAAAGHAALERGRPARVRQLLLVGIVCGLLVEFWVAPLPLVAYPNAPPPLYAWLAKQPRGLLVEFPMPTPDTLPGAEARYAYMSTFHWMPMLNGYSGYYPSSYLSRLDRLRRFPEEAAVQFLKMQGVRYIVVHTSIYPAGSTTPAESLASPLMDELGRFDDGLGVAVVFTLH